MPRFAHFGLIAALTAFATPLASPSWAETPQEPHYLMLQGGVEQEDALTAASYKLISVSDGRCPSDVMCAWEGPWRLEIEVKQQGKVSTLVLCNSCKDGNRDARLGEFSLWLKDLEPWLSAAERNGAKLELGEHHAKIAIVKGPAPWLKTAE